MWNRFFCFPHFKIYLLVCLLEFRRRRRRRRSRE
jgi:hypothetical protein